MAKQPRKPVSWKIYGGATLITVVAFLAGIAFAYFGLNYRVSNVERSVTDLFVTMLSYQEVTDIVNPCDNRDYTWLLGEELDRIGEKLSIGDYPPYLLKYYTLMEVAHMKLIKRMQKECNASVHWIIYFYGDDCPNCDAQANILTYLKSRHPKDVYIYAMKISLDSPIVKAFRIEYNVNTIPTLVIDGEPHKGIVSLAELESMLELQ